MKILAEKEQFVTKDSSDNEDEADEEIDLNECIYFFFLKNSLNKIIK